MKNLRTSLLLAAAALLSLSPARAAFDPAIVSSDARWVVYADLEALRASTLGKQLVAAAEKAQLESSKMPLGIDFQKVFKTIGNVTAYGSSFSAEPGAIDGSLVIQGTPDLRKIAEAALIQATITSPDQVKEVTGQKFPVYAIYPQKIPLSPQVANAVTESGAKMPENMEVFVAFPPEAAIFVSKSQAQLLKAREVFLGRAQSLAKTPDSPLASLISNAHSAYLFAASSVPSDAKSLPSMDATQSRILQMTHAGSLSLGEQGPLTFVHAELVASSDEMAEKLTKILQGMTAMVSLTESTDKDLQDFINSATVVRNDHAVTLNLAYASAKLSDMIENLQKAATSTATANVIGNMGGHVPHLNYGKVVSEWKAPQDAVKDGAPPAPEALLWQTIENVHLSPTSLLTIVSRTNGRVIPGKNARFDRIEITPSAGGGAPLVFRAEYMRTLAGFLAEPKPNAITGGKLLAARTPMSAAQVQFPGGEGNYTVRVAFMSGADDNTTMSLSVKNLAPTPTPADDAKPNDDAAKSGGH